MSSEKTLPRTRARTPVTGRRRLASGVRLSVLLLAALFALHGYPAAQSTTSSLRATPILIAHRGASDQAPEHTAEAYRLAIAQGADYIEIDLVYTRDGQLIALHQNLLNKVTNVADFPEFAQRRRIKYIDGKKRNGWFSEDFSLAEIKKLRIKEAHPALRPHSARLDLRYSVLSLPEIIRLVRTQEKIHRRPVGLYIELKHPSYFRSLGFNMEEELLRILARYGYTRRHDPVYIQCFEVGSLKRLRRMTSLRLTQLLGRHGGPYDARLQGRKTSYANMASRNGLQAIARYADAVGPEKYTYIIPRDENDNLDLRMATAFVSHAHQAGLEVHPYTFRAENRFLPANLRSSARLNRHGRLDTELRMFLSTGIDGLFTDNVIIARQVLTALQKKRP